MSNVGRIWVSLQTNDANDAQGCKLVVVPSRGDTFVFRWMIYRVADVRYTPIAGGAGEWITEITLILEPK
jgi:hypothetical protein